MQLALIRHGQTDWNLAGRMQGRSDIPLNATGEAQAREAASHLGTDWQFVVSSPLVRALRTAEIIASALDLVEPATDPDLVERAYGEAEGLEGARVRELRADGAVFAGEESMQALTTRAVAAIDRIGASVETDRLLIVTHGTFMRAFASFWTATSWPSPRNGEAILVRGEPGRWTIEPRIVDMGTSA